MGEGLRAGTLEQHVTAAAIPYRIEWNSDSFESMFTIEPGPRTIVHRGREVKVGCTITCKRCGASCTPEPETNLRDEMAPFVMDHFAKHMVITVEPIT